MKINRKDIETILYKLFNSELNTNIHYNSLRPNQKQNKTFIIYYLSFTHFNYIYSKLKPQASFALVVSLHFSQCMININAIAAKLCTPLACTDTQTYTQSLSHTHSHRNSGWVVHSAFCLPGSCGHVMRDELKEQGEQKVDEGMEVKDEEEMPSQGHFKQQ